MSRSALSLQSRRVMIAAFGRIQIATGAPSPSERDELFFVINPVKRDLHVERIIIFSLLSTQ
jgi:hypothetical protein